MIKGLEFLGKAAAAAVARLAASLVPVADLAARAAVAKLLADHDLATRAAVAKLREDHEATVTASGPSTKFINVP